MTTLKMSQFPVLTGTIPAGSFLIAVVPNGSGSFDNYQVDPSLMYQSIANQIQSTRWKSPPADSFAPGNDGDEAKDANYYYINVGGVWQRIPYNGIF